MRISELTLFWTGGCEELNGWVCGEIAVRVWMWSARLERWVWIVWERLKSKGRVGEALETLGASKAVDVFIAFGNAGDRPWDI